MLSPLQLIRRIVRQQTTSIDRKVTNIHGATVPVVTGVVRSADVSWLRLTVPGAELIDLDEFYQRYFLDSTHPFQLFDAPNGQLDVTDGTPGVKVYRGTVTLTQSQGIPISITLGGTTAQVALYVDGVLDRTGVGGLSTTRYFSGGTHLIEIMTLSTDVHITTPADIAIEAFDETIPQTGWADITTGYQDTTSGLSQVTLSWYVDSRVGGWKIYRRQMTPLGPITSVGSVSQAGDFSVTLTGDWEADLAVGNDLFAGPRQMGTVLSAVYFSTTGETTVRIRLPAGLTDSSGIWNGQLAETGVSVELARVRRTTSGGVASFTDNTVVLGQVYFYTIQGYGFFDETKLGPLSDVKYLVAGDRAAPDSIQILNKGVPTTGYPQVRDGIARVKFRTPSDPDYAGVRVVMRTALTGTVTSVSGTTLGVSIAGLTTSQVMGWTVALTSGASNGSERSVVDNTTTALTLGAQFDTTNLPIAGDTVTVYQDVNILTDYGLPDMDDECQFTTVGYGTYYFRTFDLAGNEQENAAAESWVYDASQDTTTTINLPPQISLTQLNVAQQAAFFPANDPRADATQYAVVLLSALDPAQADTTAGITISYAIRGGTTYTMPATTAATSGVIDNPSGTRSRYLLLTRSAFNTTLEFWSTDSSGLESEHETYTVDYDNTPQVTSMEYRDAGTNTLAFTVVVDDDTNSITYWTEPAIAADGDPSVGAPTVVDTSTNKTPVFNITLKDGGQKVVKVKPWAGANGTGDQGDVWFKEVNRQPRTTVVFESRDTSGNTSGTTVRANVLVQPPRAAIASRTLAGSGNTASALVDSGSPGWSVNAYQYSVGQKQFYFVELTSGTYSGEVRPVTGNGANTLTVSPPFPGSPDGATYRLWNAATIINTDGFKPTTQTPIGDTWIVGNTLFFDRRGSATSSFSYYSVVTGVSPEGLHTAQVDQDSAASVSGITVVENPAGKVTVTIGSFDDDVKYWRLYAKKGGVPGATVTDGNGNVYLVRDSASGRWPMDERYIRWEDTPAKSSVTFDAGQGNWCFVVIPYNAYNEDGDAHAYNLNVAGASSGTPALTGVSTAANGSTETDISWQLLNLSNPAGYTVTVKGQLDNGTVSTLASGVAASALSYAHTGIGPRAADNTSGTWHTWNYSLQLYNGATAVGSPVTVSRGDYFQGATTSLTGATATVMASGSGTAAGFGGFYNCTSSHINEVRWTTVNTNDTTYAIDVYDGTTLLASDLNPSVGYWDHVVDGFFNDAAGTVHKTWNYSVKLKQRADGTITGSASAAALTVTGRNCSPG